MNADGLRDGNPGPKRTAERAEAPAVDEADESAQRNLTAPVKENLDVLSAFEERDAAGISRMRGLIETVSAFFGSPAYFVFVLLFVGLWVGVSEWGAHHAWRHYDEAPFFWLQGIVSSNALLLTVAVLIRQNRMSDLARDRAHLDLQVNLLAEQKITRLLKLVEDRRQREQAHPPEPEARVLTEPADPEAILTAIKHKKR